MRSVFLVLMLFGLVSTQLISTQISNKTDDELSAVPMLQPQPPEALGLKILSNISSSLTTRPLISGYQEFTLVYKDITCRFKILMRERDGEQHYKYRAEAFSGVSGIEEGVRISTSDCAVIACTGDSIDTCGKRFMPYTENSTAIFEELLIESTTPSNIVNPKNWNSYNSSFYPFTINVYFLPLEPEYFDYFMEEKDNNTIHSLSLKNPEVELYTFSLLGKLFEEDSEDSTPRFGDVKRKEHIEEMGGEGGNGFLKIWDDEKEETQEDNDAGMIQNLKTYEKFPTFEN